MLALGTDYAIFPGRWQPFHNGHLAVCTRILKEYQFLILGIVNPDPENPVDPEYYKFRREENPFSYWERLDMLSVLFAELGLHDRVFFVPMLHPRTSIETEQAYLPPRNFRVWVIPIAEIDEYRKADDFHRLGERVIIIEDMPKQVLATHSVYLRFAMLRDEDWTECVPEVIAKKIQEYDGIQRIRHLHNFDQIRSTVGSIRWGNR